MENNNNNNHDDDDVNNHNELENGIANGAGRQAIKIRIYKYKKWFPRSREFFTNCSVSLCRESTDSDWYNAEAFIEDFFTAEQFDFGFGKGKTIRTGTPTGAGVQLKPEDKLSDFGNTFTMVLTDEYSWDAGPFLAATAGTFITTIIKSRHHTSNPEFGLSVAGLALWGIGFALQVAGIVDFRSLESSKREKIFAQLVSYLIAIIVIVTSGFVPSPSSSASY